MQSKDLENLRKEIHNVFATKDDFKQLDVKISENKSEIIKWMFIFWIGQVAVTFGLLILFMKK